MAALERRFAARLACMVLLSSTACTLVLPLAPVAQDAPASQPGGAMGVTATHILVAGEVCTDVAAVCGGNLVCGPEGFYTTMRSTPASTHVATRAATSQTPCSSSRCDGVAKRERLAHPDADGGAAAVP
jgi:hypothetical protein